MADQLRLRDSDVGRWDEEMIILVRWTDVCIGRCMWNRELTKTANEFVIKDSCI